MKRKLKVGDRVNDFRFGDGTIIGIDIDEAPYLVEFDKEDGCLYDGGDLFAARYGCTNFSEIVSRIKQKYNIGGK